MKGEHILGKLEISFNFLNESMNQFMNWVFLEMLTHH